MVGRIGSDFFQGDLASQEHVVDFVEPPAFVAGEEVVGIEDPDSFAADRWWSLRLVLDQVQDVGRVNIGDEGSVGPLGRFDETNQPVYVLRRE